MRLPQWAIDTGEQLGAHPAELYDYVRTYQPMGEIDSRGIWHPDRCERCSCCDQIAPPTRALPWRWLQHCHGVKHILTRLCSLPLAEARAEIKGVVNE